MVEFFLLSLVWFLNPIYFIFFSFMFSLYIMMNYSWCGVFMVLDSVTFVLLVIMSLFILSVILLSEVINSLVILSEILVVICILFFVPSNFLMLYMYFEMSMFPILVMILGFGYQIEKINSSYYLMFYAALCSFPFLFVYFSSEFLLIFSYYDLILSWEMIFILSLSFMVKFPVYFLHLWLPKAHVEAPTTASMLLAGLLLKLGTAGFFRILSSINFVCESFWMIISFLGMILGAFCCVFQSDAKSLAAYSSITHMSFLLLSLVFFSMFGKSSSLMLMLAHGYTSTLMFFFIGEMFHVSNSRMVYFLNSLFSSSIIFGIGLSVVFLSNSGVPPSLSFLSEFLTISNGLTFSFSIFIMLFIYFLVSFYYSIFFITNSLMGKMTVQYNNWLFSFSFFMIFMMYNMFWLSFFF